MANQVLTADSTQSSARTEIAQRIANDLDFVNPKPILNVTVMDGFWWCIPSLHQWWTHTIPLSLTVRERAYTTADRWWLSTISYTANQDLEERSTSLTFELETLSTNAGIVPTIVPDINEPTWDWPPIGGFDIFIDDPLVNYDTDDPNVGDIALEGDTTLEPYPDGNDDQVKVGEEKLNVPMNVSQNVSTTRDTVAGETYTISVVGDSQIELGDSFDDDLTASDGGYTTATVDAGTPGS